MIVSCVICKKQIREGQHVTFTGQAVYHEIPSAIAYAIEQPYACTSIRHLDCEDSDA